MAQRTYAEAKKANPNLDKLIKNRKAFEKGSIEYNKLQNQINRAYGVAKMRPEVAKIESRTGAKPTPKPTLKGGTTPKPVAAVKKTKASIKETAQNRKKGARYEKRDAMKELRNTTGRKRKAAKNRSVAQGADRADRRAERKQDRAQNQAKRQGARAVKKAGKKVTKMVGRAASTLDKKLKGLS